MANMKRNNLSIENAQIGFRNFSGAETRFNPKGRRNFVIFLDEETARVLEEDGWNVRFREREDSISYFLPVAVNFNNIPPKIILVTKHGKTRMDENSVGQLDGVDIENVDLTVTPYHWSVDKKSGIKAYLKTMYVTVQEEDYESKYADIDDEEIW